VAHYTELLPPAWRAKMDTKRATLCIESNPENVAAIDAWFSRWGEKLTYKSPNQGCGCCVHIWDVEAPSEAIDELPKRVLSSSKWAAT